MHSKQAQRSRFSAESAVPQLREFSVSGKRRPLSIPQAFAIAKAKVGIKSITTIRHWIALDPNLVVAEYGRLTLLDADRFDAFLESRPRQGQKWKPPPNPTPQETASVGEGGHGLHD